MSDPITDEELAEMKALWDRTTKGLWSYDDGITSITPPDPEERGKPQSIDTFVPGKGLTHIACVGEAYEQADRDGRFIVKAHADYPRLIAEIERLRRKE